MEGSPLPRVEAQPSARVVPSQCRLAPANAYVHSVYCWIAQEEGEGYYKKITAKRALPPRSRGCQEALTVFLDPMISPTSLRELPNAR